MESVQALHRQEIKKEKVKVDAILWYALNNVIACQVSLNPSMLKEYLNKCISI